MWKNVVEPDRQQNTIWHMRIACSLPKATNTHSQYVIPIALPLHQWLFERTPNVTLYVHCQHCDDIFSFNFVINKDYVQKRLAIYLLTYSMVQSPS